MFMLGSPCSIIVMFSFLVPFLILPFFTVVEYEYDISVEHVYYNSRIPFCNVNTTSETVAVCFWMLKDFQAQALNCKFSKPSM